jgi:hypothetical protein
MKTKPLAIAVALLAVASAITWFVRRPAPPPPADPRIEQPLLEPALLQQVARLRIEEAGRSIEIVRGAGGAWSVPAFYDLPASFSKLTAFLADFTETRIERLVSTSPDRVSRLGFEDSQVSLIDGSGRTIWSLTLGRAGESGGHFLRFGDEEKAYFARLSTYFDTEPINWSDQQVVKQTADDIARVELDFPGTNATMVATRPNKDVSFVAENPPGGRALFPETIPNLVNSFTALRFTWTSDPGDPDAAAARQANARRLRLTTFSGTTYTIDMAPKIQPPPAAPAEGEPEQNPVPQGPVYLWVSSSDAAAPINEIMQRRTFHMNEYLFATVPRTLEEMFVPTAP